MVLLGNGSYLGKFSMDIITVIMEVLNMKNICRMCAGELYDCECGAPVSATCNFCFICSKRNPNKKLDRKMIEKKIDNFPFKDYTDFEIGEDIKLDLKKELFGDA